NESAFRVLLQVSVLSCVTYPGFCEFRNFGAPPTAPKKPETEVKRDNPREVACKSSQTQKNRKQPQRGKQNYVVNEHSLFQENMDLSNSSRDPVPSILIEQLINVAEIFVRLVLLRGTFPLPGNYQHGEHRPRYCRLANQHFLRTALPV